MNLTLQNGEQFQVKGVHGQNIFYQGINRDCLTFLFDARTDINEIVKNFTAENCKKIVIEDGENKYLHENYTIRIALGLGYQAEALGNAVTKDGTQCVFVKMAQSTLSERQLQQQQETLDALLVATLEGNE